MQFNSDNTTAVWKPAKCGLYDIKVVETPELKVNDKGTRWIRFGKIAIVGTDSHVRDDLYITEASAWRVERLLACLIGSVQVDDEKLCSEEYRRSLVGRTGKADIGIQKYRNKQGQIRYVNEIVNFVSAKNPSINLSPDLECTTDKTLPTAGTGTATTAPRSTVQGDDLPTHDADDTIGEDEVPF